MNTGPDEGKREDYGNDYDPAELHEEIDEMEGCFFMVDGAALGRAGFPPPVLGWSDHCYCCWLSSSRSSSSSKIVGDDDGQTGRGTMMAGWCDQCDPLVIALRLWSTVEWEALSSLLLPSSLPPLPFLQTRVIPLCSVLSPCMRETDCGVDVAPQQFCNILQVFYHTVRKSAVRCTVHTPTYIDAYSEAISIQCLSDSAITRGRSRIF